MQSSKTSKKTRKSAEESGATAAEIATPDTEAKAKSRALKPSTTTKKRSSETGRATHRKTNAAEPKPVRATESSIIDPVGLMTPAPEAHEVTHSHVADLAYSYWIARDYAHGFAEEDWHRAERELKQKR